MKGRLSLWKVGPVGIVVLISVGKWVWNLMREGWGSINWQSALDLGVRNGLFVAGWVGGWIVADLDKYVASRVKVEGKAAEMMASWQASVRNVLTLGCMELLGFWAISSSGSLLAWGLVFGLSIRLYSEFLAEADYKKWYVVFARQFSDNEHKVFKILLGGMLIAQLLMLVRG